MKFPKRRIAAIGATASLSASTLALADGAHAVPVPSDQQVHIVGDNATMTGGSYNAYTVSLSQGNGAVAVGTVEVFTTKTCAGTVTGVSKHTVNSNAASGNSAMIFNMGNNPLIGQTIYNTSPTVGPIEFTIVITPPGSDSYTLSGEHYPSSSEIQAYGAHACTGGSGSGDMDGAKAMPNSFVAHWSAKKGKTKVGKQVKVTATKLSASAKKNHVKVTYTWKVGGVAKTHAKFLRLNKAYRHKKVTMTVTLTAPGYRAKGKTLSFGRAS